MISVLRTVLIYIYIAMTITFFTDRPTIPFAGGSYNFELNVGV